ncbi:MAG: hypothetical protein COB53_01675 [Elusimicrobia bacterium]|nr:MAG: hypothetical protein COB53_01675 [Elusimicrobiota bacterium]
MIRKVIKILTISVFSLVLMSGLEAAAAPKHKPSPHYSIKKIKMLREGKYRAILDGILCNSCTRSIVLRLKKISGVENAQFDFEEGYLWITIEENAHVRTSKVLRALRLAGRKNNLGTRFTITEIRNVR